MTVRRSIDLAKAKDPAVVRNHHEDRTYAPYCLRCRGLRRMVVVKPYYFKCSCGAIHDETAVIALVEDGE